MGEQSSFDSAHRTHPVFVDISSERNLALLVSPSDTIANMKIKLMDEYASCFPNLEPLMISGLKVKRRGKFYHLPESLLVRDAFHGVKGNWFLHVDASTFNNKDQETCSPKSLENPMGDVDCPQNFEKSVSEVEKLEREVDCAREISLSTVLKCDLKQDLPVEDIQGNDDTIFESETVRANETDDASTIARQELPDLVMDEPLNSDPTVFGGNAQEKVCAEVGDNGVGNTLSNFHSNQDVAMEVYTDYEKYDSIKKQKKKNKSKETQSSEKDKSPGFEEVVLNGNVQENVGAEMGKFHSNQDVAMEAYTDYEKNDSIKKQQKESNNSKETQSSEKDMSPGFEEIVLNGNVQESVGAEVGNFYSNQDVAIEAYSDHEKDESIMKKKKKKKNKSKEPESSAKDKVPGFEEVVLNGNVQESVGVEVGLNSLEKPVGELPNSSNVGESPSLLESKGNVAEEKANDFELNSITDCRSDPNQDVPIESVKVDVKSSFKSKKKRKNIVDDDSTVSKSNINEPVQDNSFKPHDAIMRECIQKKMNRSQGSTPKEPLLDNTFNEMTEKKDESLQMNDTCANHHNQSEDIGNDFCKSSQSLNVDPFHEKQDLCLNDKKRKRKKRKDISQSNISVGDKDVSMNEKFDTDNAGADQHNHDTYQNIGASIEGDVKRGDDQEITPFSGGIDHKLHDKTTRKDKKKKKKIEESETSLKNKDENQMCASKEQQTLSNPHVVDFNFETNDCQKVEDSTNPHIDKAQEESDRNVENIILSIIHKDNKKKKNKKKHANDSLLDEGASESSLNRNSKELPFNGLEASPISKNHHCNENIRVSAETEMDANETIVTENAQAKDDNTSQVEKTDVCEKPSKKPKKSKGSKKSDYFIKPIESANCKLPENEVASDTIATKANPQSKLEKPIKNGFGQQQTKENSKIEEKKVAEGNDDSETIEYSTYSDSSEEGSEVICRESKWQQKQIF